MPTTEAVTLARMEMLPEHIRHGVEDYVLHGAEPGDFLHALVTNDLRRTCEHADRINRLVLFDIVSWFYNYAPSQCWGSPELYARWVEHKGLTGGGA
jgi:hypothetical protein